ncbi:MAG: hypothetical protein NTW86_26230, partial [Candidatus Sumerlaeota bacterium]|nr:hypothetical protein [Candidatus Sumerlaeota bacterium]
MRARTLAFVLSIGVLVFRGVAAGAPPREEMSLNGQWQAQKAADLAFPPAGEWKPAPVPGYLVGVNYERAWLKREFQAPPSMRGRRVELDFGGVKWNSVIYLNGEKVGGHFGGYEPFTVDITDRVRFDQPNELLVGVCDWTGVFLDRKTDLTGQKGQETRHVVKDEILAPVGGLIDMYGIWDEVTLRAHPATYIQDCFIQPSVRRGELTVRATIANADSSDRAVAIAGVVLDGEREALALPAAQATIPAGKEAAVLLKAPWPNAHLWSHEDPYLYRLRLSLRDLKAAEGAPTDELTIRFGFREFWTQGPDFYLNGKKIHMLATASWPPREWTENEAILKKMELIKASHTIAMRTHTQPWPRKWYDMADEAGLLMIPEGAIWNDDDAYRIHDPRFWDNYAAHLSAMVGNLKNHPSVVMWSLENEFHGNRMNDQSPALKDLVRMGQLVKQADPTRPITYESDNDPGGASDVLGIHYPHEYPQFTQWPNEADWLDAPIHLNNTFLDDKKEFFWERKKPLYIGEFLWIPSTDPSGQTVFFGDECYRDYGRCKKMAKGESWRMQILGYRRHDVSGISPWNMFEGGPLDDTNPMYMGQTWAYRHVAAFLREYDRNFFAGEPVKRVADLYNDTLSDGTFEFSWKLAGNGAKETGASESATLAPGAHETRAWEIPAPEAKERAPLTLTVDMLRDGKTESHEDYPFIVWPRPRLQAPAGAVVGVFVPAGKTAPALKRLGLEFC